MTELFRFNGPNYPRTLSFSADGNTLCAWYDEYPGGKAILWDVGERMELATLTHPSDVKTARIAATGKTVFGVTGQGQYEIVAWDVATEKRHDGEGARIDTDTFRLAVSPDGTTLATLGSGQKPRLWDAATRQSKQELDGFTAYHPCDLAFTPDGKYLIGLGRQGQLTVWLVARGKAKAIPPIPSEIEPACLAISPDSSLLAIGEDRSGEFPRVVLIDLAGGNAKAGFDAVPINGSTGCLAFSADGKILGVGGPHLDGVLFLDTTSGQMVKRLAVPELVSVAFSPDGKYFLAGTARDIRVFGGAIVA